MPSGTVLVTGASTGIGHATVLHLRELGFDPIAAVRKDEDAERLGGQGVRTARIDVTDADQIAAAREALGDEALAGLVNNAGIAVAAPLEFLPIDRLRQQLEINLIGQVAVTQAFLPALRRARGRVVNVSSIGGLVGLPLVGAYAASKFGLEGVSDSLRRELRAQGVDVVLIEPGGVKTPIWKKGERLADEMTEGMPPEAERLYGRMIEALRAETAKIEQERGIEPREVAEVIGRALTAPRPRARYLVGRDAKMRADGEDPARPRDGPADRPRAPRLVQTLRQRLALALLDLLERQLAVALVREAHLGRGRQGGCVRPALRVPERRTHERLRAVRVDLLCLHHDRRLRRLADRREALEQLRSRRHRGVAVHAQRGVASGDHEDQGHAAARYHVLERVEAPIAGGVRDRQMLVVEHRHEARLAAARAHVAVPLRRKGGHEQHRRGGDQPPTELVDVADVLADGHLHRRVVQLAQLLRTLERAAERIRGWHERTIPGTASGQGARTCAGPRAARAGLRAPAAPPRPGRA